VPLLLIPPVNVDMLMNSWPEWNASDNQLARCLSEVRQALGSRHRRAVR
jgi:DNA-binding winged helix-turn-helix (wHTH) protein